jgi:hypothetical protein
MVLLDPQLREVTARARKFQQLARAELSLLAIERFEVQ